MPNFTKKSGLLPVATPDSSNNPRRTFETAIALMQPSRAPSKTPIGWRNRASLGSSPADEKRAVTDAARALAQLWNIAPGTAR